MIILMRKQIKEKIKREIEHLHSFACERSEDDDVVVVVVRYQFKRDSFRFSVVPVAAMPPPPLYFLFLRVCTLANETTRLCGSEIETLNVAFYCVSRRMHSKYTRNSFYLFTVGDWRRQCRQHRSNDTTHGQNIAEAECAYYWYSMESGDRGMSFVGVPLARQ